MSLLLLLASTAHAATLTVGPSETYTTIAAALAGAASGDTILVKPGTYAEDLDLRGRTVTVMSEDGPWVTTIAPTNSIRLDGGTLEGFTVSPAPSTALIITSGSPTVRQLVIEGPATHGVSISGGSPVVEEVLVTGAGQHGFLVTGGTPTLRRDVAYGVGSYGFDLRAATTIQSCVAIGGAWGFVFETTASTASNLTAVGTSTGATAALTATTVTNGVFAYNPVTLRCFSGSTLTFPNGIAYDTGTTTGCTGTPLASMDAVDPQFTAYSATSSLYRMDLRPRAGSPMKDGGTGTDPDGGTADLGAFGGSGADWTDADGDGYPVIFDCDDHDGFTNGYATERADAKDNDCDDVIDEDIPVDTGDPGDDTGTPGDDTAVVDTGNPDTDTDDTQDTEDTEDTEPSGNEDLDGDGFTASTDCDEHNVATFPGAPERMDDADNDCDSRVDEGTARGDDDGDTFDELGGDCDDTRADRYPGANDEGRDGLDNDCDGVADDSEGSDRDGDDRLDSMSDCDDNNPEVGAEMPDPTNGVDDDCDGLADDDELRTDGDGDGLTPEMGDCDDADPTIREGITDVPDDFIDQDCSGTDNHDVDRDGHDAPASGGNDCDDTRSTVHPGAGEICGDEADNDCDDATDEDCDTGAPPVSSGGGCGCASGDLPASTGVLAVGLALAIRRRRSR